MRAIPLIVNSRSGTGADGVVERLTGLYRAAGAEVSPRVAKSGADLPALAREVAREQPPLVVAAGGDGTINAVASALVGGTTALGVIRCGTLNHLARDLGIPLDQTDAVVATLRGRAREVDVGEVNGRFFLNNSSLGLYPDIVRRPHASSNAVWAAASGGRCCGRRTRCCAPSVHGRHARARRQEFARRTPFVFIGNNVYRWRASTSAGARASTPAC